MGRKKRADLSPSYHAALDDDLWLLTEVGRLPKNQVGEPASEGGTISAWKTSREGQPIREACSLSRFDGADKVAAAVSNGGVDGVLAEGRKSWSQVSSASTDRWHQAREEKMDLM
jgi:hypothetical protein